MDEQDIQDKKEIKKALLLLCALFKKLVKQKVCFK